jgi:D-sedoheptulose 7-phosphate isomerase
MKDVIKKEFEDHIFTSQATIDSICSQIEVAAKICINSLQDGGKILIFGNGGSAADAQHIASELVGRYKAERKGLSAIALTTDSSAITSISNDYGYLKVFERQVESLAKVNDVVIGISTGGTSANVINGINAAKKMGCKAIGLSGKDGGDFNKICDLNIVVPHHDTPRIQEMHILIGHTICHLIDKTFV